MGCLEAIITWASPLGPGNKAATAPVMTAANGIDRWYTQSASVTWPIAILRPGPDGRYGPPKSNEGVKEKEEKVDDEEDEGDKKNEKMKAVEDEFTEKFKMALRITASKSSRKQIVRRAGHYALQTTSSVKHRLRRNRVAIRNSRIPWEFILKDCCLASRR
ncbi:hypothetical protein ALT_4693 [Aspergillus lentulus]|uniref:Uncharacterized protein n=1 Tax=Aspergillus lentulus TaxID=293939 RepID=A0AAN4TAZ2_ASPLE|nr:uncharacterized protein IFM58399_02378 [Aspergillus lentulus]KAF4152604.1 hypothetical protein CNMCM6069_001875 [Aspergillus lentulus]KAF4183954.1 hypothetical protein CNMCM7927_008506 [Aspergillus lentulus]GAQ07372.1 hypothetical protein ALT_4693 [Aspergillus lentulus]GFF29796.1 hypothetical protein IFM58399_02378 [Aspergillus lentulus]GFF59135.1 hypothetical protein IFM62136_04061 [Aspergillus lentulus]